MQQKLRPKGKSMIGTAPGMITSNANSRERPVHPEYTADEHRKRYIVSRPHLSGQGNDHAAYSKSEENNGNCFSGREPKSHDARDGGSKRRS